MASWGPGQLRLDCDLADTNGYYPLGLSNRNSFRYVGTLTDGNDLSGREVRAAHFAYATRAFLVLSTD